MKRGFLNADYEEGVSGTFEGLRLTIMEDGKKDEIIKFNTGNPTVDFIDYSLGIPDGVSHVSHSSSIDHWYMDDDDYTSVFIKYADEEGGEHRLFHRGEVNEDFSEAAKLYWDNKLFEYPLHRDMVDKIKCFEDFRAHYKELKNE